MEALTLLASLHLHPELYRVAKGDAIKDKMVEILFQAARTEPDQQPRCVCVCACVFVFVCSQAQIYSIF